MKTVKNESNEVRIQNSKWGLIWSNAWLIWACMFTYLIYEARDWYFFGFMIPLILLVALQTKYGRWR